MLPIKNSTTFSAPHYSPMCADIPKGTYRFDIIFENSRLPDAEMAADIQFVSSGFKIDVKIFYVSKSHEFNSFPCRGILVIDVFAVMAFDDRFFHNGIIDTLECADI